MRVLPTTWRQKSTGIDVEQNYITAPYVYRVAQNKIPHWRICNISATGGLILKILEAA